MSAPARRERGSPAGLWSAAAGWAGIAMLVLAGIMAARPSRADRREILGRYSPEYAMAIVVVAMAGAWWIGGLRGAKSSWGLAAGGGFRTTARFAGVSALTLGAGELVCRIAERPLSHFIGGPALARRYAAMVHLNSHGLRDPERPLAKPAGTWRVLVLGDSFMFGQGVPDESTCVRHMERMLAVPGGPRVEVINTARTGYNTAQERAVLDTLGLRFQPDLVLVGYLLNDAEPANLTFPLLLPEGIAVYLKDSVLYQTLRAGVYYMQVAVHARPNYTEYIHQINGIRSAGWTQHADTVRALVADAHAAGVPVVIALWPLIDRASAFSPYPFVEEQTRAAAICADAGAYVIDLLPVFAHDSYRDFAVSDWDAHPNANSHRRAADAIVAFMGANRLSPQAPHAATGAATSRLPHSRR